MKIQQLWPKYLSLTILVQTFLSLADHLFDIGVLASILSALIPSAVMQIFVLLSRIGIHLPFFIVFISLFVFMTVSILFANMNEADRENGEWVKLFFVLIAFYIAGVLTKIISPFLSGLPDSVRDVFSFLLLILIFLFILGRLDLSSHDHGRSTLLKITLSVVSTIMVGTIYCLQFIHLSVDLGLANPSIAPFSLGINFSRLNDSLEPIGVIFGENNPPMIWPFLYGTLIIALIPFMLLYAGMARMVNLYKLGLDYLISLTIVGVLVLLSLGVSQLGLQ